MKKKTVTALILSLLLMFSISATAFADSSTTATVPVTLTVSNEYRSVNVTVPASLPIYVINGKVVVADSAKITNNSKTGSVQVTGLSVTDGAYKVGNYDSFSGSKTIALKINGSAWKTMGLTPSTSSNSIRRTSDAVFRSRMYGRRLRRRHRHVSLCRQRAMLPRGRTQGQRGITTRLPYGFDLYGSLNLRSDT